MDAAKGDLIGDCELTPDLYYCMTRSLLQVGVSDIPITVALEGGYNVNVIAKCMEGVALALLDEPWDPTSEHRAWSKGENELDALQDDCGRLTRARNALSCYWDHNESCNRINPSAARCLNKTMAALESSELWMDRITFRRLVPATPDRTPRKMRTRASRNKDDDLNNLMDSLAL